MTNENYSGEIDTYNEVEKAWHLGLKVIVGGSWAFKIAPKFGIKCVRLLTSKEEFIKSFERAKETVRVLQEKQAEMERLKIILNMETNGIISIDELMILRR